MIPDALPGAELVEQGRALAAETAERLRHLSDICHADEKSVAASLLHDILKDDEEAHVSPAQQSHHLH